MSISVEFVYFPGNKLTNSYKLEKETRKNPFKKKVSNSFHTCNLYIRRSLMDLSKGELLYEIIMKAFRIDS